MDETNRPSDHFECCTFDHSDNSPCMWFRISSKNFWKELTERTTKYSIFEPKKTLNFTGFLSGANSQLFKKFRVLHLRPLGQLSVSIFVRFSFQKFAQKFVGEKTGETAKNIRFWDFLCWGISRRIRGTKFPASAEISSQGRYDHFDTCPYF